MIKVCKNCQQNFEITDDDLKFYEKISPVFGGEKYLIPAPSLCPDCRLQRRMSWRNDRNFYKRKCDFSGKEMISMYKPGNLKVYDHEIWWGDKWDTSEYAQEYDFNKSFFEQLSELIYNVPHPNVIQLGNENSLYTNFTAWNKNCYICSAGNKLEDSAYCYNVQESKDCFDCLNLLYCELCYQTIHCENCYKLYFSPHSKNCQESYFLEDCIGCSHCLLCSNLQHKEYCILNKQYTKEEYLKKIQEYKLNTYDGIINAFNIWQKERIKYPKKANHNIFAENCTGEYISHSKNCENCYLIHKNNEDCKHIFAGFPNLKDSYDCIYTGEEAELIYEGMCSGDGTLKCAFVQVVVTGSADIYYGDYLINCQNCFGCSGLKHKQYCILNKQYAKEEYEKLVPKIIEAMKSPKSPLTRGLGHPLDKGGLGDCEWGEFFPSSISPFGYNETVAQEYFPLTKEEALLKGFKWSDYELEFPHVEKTIPANLLPEIISEIPDDILNWAILPVQTLQCDVSTKPFKIIKPELDFYRKMNLPIPRKHPDQRHKDRMALRNPRKLWKRNCMKCNAEIQTTFSPERKEIVYCDQCYLKEVY